MYLDFQAYKSKVIGCWMGKNIGGTLGTPFEGHRGVFDLDFYTHNIDGDPLPNDDLDLQLVWLYVVEKYGRAVDNNILGEFWHNYITADWSEYGTGKNNMRMGICPPLSGAVNNVYKDSNGAWIRSEIWACLAPGNPDIAVRYAFEDATVDHSGEGLYGEVFCAAIQSAAFAESDIYKLIDIALSYIPNDCGVAKAVNDVLDSYRSGISWKEARKKLMTLVPGCFCFHFHDDDLPVGPRGYDAPSNIGIMVIGLCYGEGDFGKSVCIAAGCGDDADCTAGTLAALYGIIHGIEKIPEEWIKPIGRGIKTMSIGITDWQFRPPATVDELTERVVRQTPVFLGAELCDTINCTNGYKIIMQDNLYCNADFGGCWTMKAEFSELMKQSPYCRKDDFVIFNTVLDYGQNPYIRANEPFTLRLTIENNSRRQQWLSVRWHLPEGVTVSPSGVVAVPLESYHLNVGKTALEFTLTAEYLKDERIDPIIEIRSVGRHTKGLIPVMLINGANVVIPN
jgi:ADP-ribosylglycohydrolase